MAKLWHKKGAHVHPLVARYMKSDDLAPDKTLLPYDIQASIAHAKMLAHVRLIPQKEARQLVAVLNTAAALAKKGTFRMTSDDEDCHSAIENYLVKKLGDVGKKIHTGRSRNDQVLVALRLFCREQLKTVQSQMLHCAERILSFAQKHEFVPMPGYTHTQQAMPSSVGQWAGSFVESLLDDCTMLQAAYELNNQNPLGSAAGFGTSLPIDRMYTTKQLGFKKVQTNSLYCQNSRGKIEAFMVSALLQVMMTLGKIANDMIWFTTKEFSFFTVDSKLTTGSSIMPQKRNLDFLEVLRANVSVVLSYQVQIESVSLNLLSGYNKDSKVTKKPLLESFRIVSDSLDVIDLLFRTMKPNEKKLSRAFTPVIFATDEANRLVLTGMAFRDAYRTVGESLGTLISQDIQKNLRGKKHLGAPGNLRLNFYERRIRQLKKK